MFKSVRVFLMILSLLVTFIAHGQAKNATMSGPSAKAKTSRAGDPIEVRGQSRNLNMLLILQQQGEVIDFIKLRENYQPEMKKTAY